MVFDHRILGLPVLRAMLLDVVRDGVSWLWLTTWGISPRAMAARATTGWCLRAVDGAGTLLLFGCGRSTSLFSTKGRWIASRGC